MDFPKDLKFTKDHEWVRIEGNTATVGITEFAQGELGELVFVDLPAKGKSLKAHDTACVVESTKAASDVYSPIGGTVAEVNSALSNTPNLVNSDCYGQGWLLKLSPFNAADAEGLMSPADYQKLLNK
jgi:glycine cleavage system H protein